MQAPLASRSGRRALVCSVVALALGALSFSNAGCKKKKVDVPDAAPAAKVQTIDDVIAEYKPKVDPKIQSAIKIGANLPKATGHDALKPEKGAIHMLVADTKVLAFGTDAAVSTVNATIVHAEDLRGDLTTEATMEYDIGERLIIDCAAILAKKTPATPSYTPESNPKGAARVLAQCASLTYLFVIREASHTAPTVNEGAHSFTAGHVEGDVLVFDLDSGKSIGDYKFTARNPHDINLLPSDALHGLEKDVRERMWTSVRDTFEKLAPGSSVVTAY